MKLTFTMPTRGAQIPKTAATCVTCGRLLTLHAVRLCAACGGRTCGAPRCRRTHLAHCAGREPRAQEVRP